MMFCSQPTPVNLWMWTLAMLQYRCEKKARNQILLLGTTHTPGDSMARIIVAQLGSGSVLSGLALPCAESIAALACRAALCGHCAWLCRLQSSTLCRVPSYHRLASMAGPLQVVRGGQPLRCQVDKGADL
jgi:hypothetical protein